MAEQDCYWKNLFSELERDCLRNGFIITGLVSVVCNVLLNLTFFLTELKRDASYRNLAYFTLTSGIRCLFNIVTYLGIFKFFDNSQNVQIVPCRFIGFWDSFLGVLEVEGLTHVCIERYVVAKYITHGWPIRKNHYILYPSLCFLFAALYSLPGLFGFGAYNNDFTCNSCTFDMILPQSWQRYLVVLIFMLKSVKSAGFMIVMFYWCHQIERKYNNIVTLHNEQKNITKIAGIVTVVNVVCWSPIVVLRGTVVASQFFGDTFWPSVSFVKWAMIFSWFSPGATSIAMFLFDDRLRSQKTVNNDKKDM